MGIFIVRPRIPCIVIFAVCIFFHLIVALYGCVQIVWYPIAYGFLMTIIYIIAIVCVILRLKILYILLALVMAILLFLLFVFWILTIYMTIDLPPEATDIPYDLFPQNGNWIETYRVLGIAMILSSLFLLILNTIGLLAIVYAFFHNRDHADSQVVTSVHVL